MITFYFPPLVLRISNLKTKVTVSSNNRRNGPMASPTFEEWSRKSLQSSIVAASSKPHLGLCKEFLRVGYPLPVLYPTAVAIEAYDQLY